MMKQKTICPHPDRPNHAQGFCRACWFNIKYHTDDEFREKFRKRQVIYGKAYRKKHPEDLERKKLWRKKNPEKYMKSMTLSMVKTYLKREIVTPKEVRKVIDDFERKVERIEREKGD